MRVCMLSPSVVSDSCESTSCSPPGSSVDPMGFSRQEYWRGLPFPPPEDLPDPGIKPTPLMSPALAVGFFTTGTACEARRSWQT